MVSQDLLRFHEQSISWNSIKSGKVAAKFEASNRISAFVYGQV